MTDEPAAIVTDKISAIPYFVPESKSFGDFMAEGKISYIGEDLWERYYNAVLAEAVNPEVIADAELNMVYTPLCGTGNEPVREILGRLGVNITVVACQSYKVARGVACDVVLGTDPDADRVAIAIPDGDGFRKLSGNELGCLLLDYVLKGRSKKNDMPQGAITVRSIVSSPLADRIAKHYGVEMRAVLTGFKYIGGEILALEQKGEESRFVFGFEESCGYLKGTYARDKDAILASMLVCELAATLKKQGKTILDALESLYETYGQYLAYVQSVELTGADAMEKATKIMTDLRNVVPKSVGGAAVTAVRDYKASIYRNLVSGNETAIDLPKSNVLEFLLGDRGSVIVRPSGTEPKVKFYYTAVGATKAEAQALLDKMIEQMSK